MKSYIERYKLEGRVGAISVGVPSMVSKDKSFIYSTPNLKGLENIDLGHLLGDYVNIPVFVDRDVNYLLVNDIKTHGLDPDRERTILGFYLGTGFGNAVYINGQLHVGKTAWPESLAIFRCTASKKPVPAEISDVLKPGVPADICVI